MSDSRLFSICLASPAKINLGLMIPYRYDNGYHHIVSLMAKTDFADQLEISLLPQAGFALQFVNQLPAAYAQSLGEAFLPENMQQNLIARTWQWLLAQEPALADRHPVTAAFLRSQPGLQVTIHKRVPSPCGLGGGSSNAASLILAFLAYCRQLETSDESFGQLQAYFQKRSLQLGSDIPFFLGQQAALVSGIGEISQYVQLPPFCGILMIPTFGFSTAAMYKSLKKALHNEPASAISLQRSLHRQAGLIKSFFESAQTGDQPVETGDVKMIENDFFQAARELYPEKAEHLSALLSRAGQLLQAGKWNVFSSMSGSGSAAYSVIFGAGLQAEESAEQAIATLQGEYPDCTWLKIKG